jgi:superoxide dismutase
LYESHTKDMKTIYALPYTEIDGFLSALQLSEHCKLYEGYYNQARDLPAKVNGMGATENWAGIRGVQKTLQYALSGRELHEIYFDLMSPTPTNYEADASELLKSSITTCFGSIEQFVSDMTAAAKTRSNQSHIISQCRRFSRRRVYLRFLASYRAGYV